MPHGILTLVLKEDSNMKFAAGALLCGALYFVTKKLFSSEAIMDIIIAADTEPSFTGEKTGRPKHL